MSETESEIIKFIQSWMIVYTCLAYTYVVGKTVHPGKVRSLLILPVVALFLLLPLRLTSIILCGLTALFVSWVGSFKLALFSFGKGPLATDITFSQFLAVGSLPITFTKKSDKSTLVNIDDPCTSIKGRIFAVKVVIFALIYQMDRFKSQFPQVIIFSMYSAHAYLTLEFTAFGIRAVAEPLLGLELDPPFNEPMISTSVQNFWGRRWNIAVGSILRASVYDPVRAVLSPYVGSEHAKRLGVLATFGTSAIMHEIIFYYLSRKHPTWDMACYFLLHGVIVVVERDVKRLVGNKLRLPWVVSVSLTLSLLYLPAFPFIIPKIEHCNNGYARAVGEEFAPFPTTFVNSTR